MQEELAIRLPMEDPERLLKTLVLWGRFAELFGHDPDAEVLYVTSALEGLTDPEPADGMPLEIRGTGARGTPAHRFAG